MAYITLDLQRADVSYKATFAAPQFTILMNAGRAFQALHSRLTTYGLKLADIKVEGVAAQPSNFAIACTFPALNAVLRLKLESIELNAYSVAKSAALPPILSEAIEAAKEIGAAGGGYKPILYQQIVLESHGTLADVDARTFLASYVARNPWSTEADQHVSFAFNLGQNPTQGRLGASIVASPSSVLSKGLYVQINATFAGHFTLNDTVDRFLAFAREAYANLGLQPKDALPESHKQ